MPSSTTKKGRASRKSGVRNLVVCMDGTGNAPKATSNTNVLRIYGMLENSERQLTFYTPGVGTRGDPAALTLAAKVWTKIRGLITGYGIRRDIAEAYTFLIENYRPGDRIYVFGFSRGSFAALALVALLRLYGILKPTQRNMIGETIDRLSLPTKRSLVIGTYRYRGLFARHSQEGEQWWVAPVHFVGLFDTVKALKYFKLLTRVREEALHRRYHPSYPFTTRPENAEIVRHAVSLDDRRFPYDPFTLTPDKTVDFDQVWFAGVHSDIGGSFEDRDDPCGSLGRVTLKWMVDGALASGLHFEDGKYKEHCTVKTPARVDSTAKPNRNSVFWLVLGWSRRLRRRLLRRRFLSRPIWRWFAPIAVESIRVHQSVLDRDKPRLPTSKHLDYVAADTDWTDPRSDEGYLEPGPSSETEGPDPQGHLANFAASLIVWIIATAAIGAGLVTWVGADAGFVKLASWLLIAPAAFFRLGEFGFDTGWATGLFVTAAALATVVWLSLIVTVVELIRGGRDGERLTRS